MQQLLCLTCCRGTPQKIQSFSARPVTHWTTLTTITSFQLDVLQTALGCLPACFLFFFFFFALHTHAPFLHPLCILLPDHHHTFPVLLTVCQCSVQCWQVIFYLCHCSPHVCHLRDRWTCVTPNSLLNGELYVSLSKPCSRMHAERCPPPYQSMCVSLSAAKAWGKGSVF